MLRSIFKTVAQKIGRKISRFFDQKDYRRSLEWELVEAAIANDIEKVRQLIAEGAAPEAVSHWKEPFGTPLDIAVKNKNREMAELLGRALMYGRSIRQSRMSFILQGSLNPAVSHLPPQYRPFPT